MKSPGDKRSTVLEALLAGALLAACSGEMPDGDLGTYVPPAVDPGAAGAAARSSDTGVPPGGSNPGPPDAGSPQDAGKPAYDPDVAFTWPEADPTLVCRPGTYTGRFNCQMSAGGPFPTGPYEGPVSFLLRQSANGEFLEIENGTLRGTVAGLLLEFTADLVGRLDCRTDQFRANVANGVFFGGTFSGTLEGKLERRTQTVTGAWNMGVPLGPPCIGPFSVVRSP